MTATRIALQERHVGRNGRAYAFGAICMANFMILFDGTVVNLAIPAIGSDLGGSLANLEWAVSGYTIALASFILSGGTLGDRFRNERVLTWGLITFTTASLLCGLAPTLLTLVAFRVVQGAAAALMLPAVLALLPHLFPDAKERSRAVSTWASIGGLAVASGPVLGGVLVHWFDWRAVFFINIPVGIVTIVGVSRYIRPSEISASQRFDLPGQGLAALALGAGCFLLIESSSRSLVSPVMIVATAGACAAGVTLIIVEKCSDHPMVPAALFRIPSYRRSVAMVSIWQFVFFGELFVFSVYLQDSLKHSTFTAGLAFLPMTILTAIIPVMVTTRLVEKFSRKASIMLGAGFGIAACVMVQFVGPYWILALAMALFGAFAGLTLPPIVAGGVADIDASQSGRASGVMNSARQLGGVIGVATLANATGFAGDFTDGMHWGALICALLLLAMGLTAIRGTQRLANHPDSKAV